MTKSFFEVFQSLQLKNELSILFEQVQVERISSTKRKDFLRIYILSENLIMKDQIFKVEEEIKKQLFPTADMVIKIYEKFQLSKQYNPEKLMNIYKESILLELREYSLVEYNLFKKAKLDYPSENIIKLTIIESVFAQLKAEELLRVLEKIFNERCGFQVVFQTEYEQPVETITNEGDVIIARQVAEIVARTAGAIAKNGEEEGGQKPPETSQNGKMLLPDSNETVGEKIFDSNSGIESTGINNIQDDQESARNQKQQQSSKRSEESIMEAAKTALKDSENKLSQKPASSGKENGFKGKSSFEKGEFKYGKKMKTSDDPNVIYGRDIEEETIAIEEIQGEMGEVVIRGQILGVEKRPIRNEKTILTFYITDFTDTITVKMFCKDEQLSELETGIKQGAFLKIKGVTVIDKFDSDLTIASVAGIKKIPDFTTSRMDNSVKKRVELHCHTKMSDMDGVSETKDIVKRAYKWGHPAIAITDHGNVQAFPDANHVWDDLWKVEKAKRKEAGDENPNKNDFFKVIYGVEGYLVDDLKEIVSNCREQNINETYVVFDLETTGFSAVRNKIIEIGAVKIRDEKIIEHFSSFVNPKTPIPFNIEQLTGIKDDMVIDAPVIEDILPQFMKFCEGAVLVAHNAGFDMSFIKQNTKKCNIPCEFTYVDTVGLARMLFPEHAKHTLDAVAKMVGVSLEKHHRAIDDAQATAEIYLKFIPMLKDRGADTLHKVNALGAASDDVIRRLPSYHVIILAQNNIGRVNLYRLISESHLRYYNKRPNIPKSRIMKYREGLIIGSACEAGELYRAILDEKNESEIARIVNFYDYLEIQPAGNNKFMIESEKIATVNSVEDILEINKTIVKLGEHFQKPVVATCDVHFLDPEDEIYRKIIMTGKGFKDADDQAPLYLRTTEEMLKEFSYLGSDKAEEVVITNTNLIADRIETISPVRPDKCPPVIENSDKTLTDICYHRAHELYGDPLPAIVETRLEKELHSIITNGFAVMYIIAQKLVWKSNEDGYLVGSRGSVGSSFVATMSGITEVNPLSPHYYCLNCHYSDFESEEVTAYSGETGIDMPDKNCPVCGEKLQKDGFDIPFETFLGFKGDKEPDIDLNFSGEYQSKAHKYTEVIFGAGQTFRAGTIGTLADKTAFGYVKNYYEEHGKKKRTCEINRIVSGCTGIRRTTGQHPGGIIVLPLGEEINSFTPVQHPANDMTTDIITTHFDYHSIDHNLLKLDILGHDDPTMIRMLQDLTGIDPVKIPLDDPEVMTLFQSTKALGISPDQIGGCKLGSLGIPEFGTEFVIQMLIDTKPTSFSDLVRISGLSHGTDVWVGNAATLIEEGKATISTAICTRDDIMLYLIKMGVESSLSFTIMESVRKGKGLKPEWEVAMTDAGVPDWYIWSCKKIQYMFPKAHAAAYVMMAWRIAYCKIKHPLAYYAAYYSIRASAFSYEIMCQGQKHLENIMNDYRKRMDELSKKDQDTFKDMKVVQEMYARGIEFEPIDIFTAQSRLFQIVDNKVMPSLNSIEGLGEKAADTIVEASKDGPYLSKDDFRIRTKASKTVIDLMDSLNLLGNIPESNQISLFDFM